MLSTIVEPMIYLAAIVPIGSGEISTSANNIKLMNYEELILRVKFQSVWKAPFILIIGSLNKNISKIFGQWI